MGDNVKGSLKSNLDHPVTLSYDGQGMTVWPRAVVENIDQARLGSLPKGVRFVPNAE